MLETWLKKTREGMAEHGSKPFRWMRVFPPSIWIIVMVIALVGGRLFWVNASRPAHRKEITDTFGSVSLFYGVPQANHDGSQFTYVATDAQGYALFLCDASTGRKRIVREENGLGPWGDAFDLRAWPWSPDDSTFIYSTRDKLFVCPVVDINTTNPTSININGASDVIWLNPLEFAWLEGGTICFAHRPADGEWKVQRLPHQGQVLSLTAVDAHTIAWFQEDFICRLELTDDLNATNNPFAPLNTDAYTVPLTNNLMLWLDAAGLQQSNNTPVTSLADLSRRKNNAIANHNPPTYNAPDSLGALNRNGTIHFQSGDSILDATGLKTIRRLGLSGSQPRSVFAVMRRDASRSKMLINIGNTLTNGSYFGLCDQNDFLYLPSGSFSGRKDGRMAPVPAAWHILETVYDESGSKSYVNGGFRGAVTLPFYTVDREVEIGLRTPPNNRSLTNMASSDGDFAELLIYDRSLNFTEQRQVEDYLGAKWFGSRPLSPKTSFVWLDPEMTGLTGFNYSKETGRLLIRRAENGRDTLWRMETGKEPLGDPTQILQGRFLRDVQWTGPREFAYTSREIGHQGLLMADLSGKQNAPLFQRGNIGWFKVTPDQKKVLFWGNISNEPAAGIWQCDLVNGEIRSVVPASDFSSPYAHQLNSTYGALKIASGRTLHYHLFFPADFDRHKKYPLVIGSTPVGVMMNGPHGRQWAPDIATCGAFVITVDRTGWFESLNQWEENVLSVYQHLCQDPCLDLHRVYLFSASAETQPMSQLLAKSPGLWKGAIFLNPSGLPDFSKSPPFQARPKILISTGGEEHQEARFKTFQMDALNSGVMTEIIIHPGENHHVVGNAAQLARTKAMMHFIFEE
jgi:hypothetical protein